MRLILEFPELTQTVWPLFPKRLNQYVQDSKRFTKVGDTGLEPVTPSVSCWCSSQLS